MANTSWNPADKTASITLTNSNLTATSGAANQDVRATDKQTTGKFYWEITLTTASANYGSGCANGAATLGSLYNTPTNAVIVYTSGSIWLNNASTGTNIGSLAGGGVILCIALDVGGSLFWARNGAAGNWNNSGAANPATGVGGINISSINSGGLYPATCFAFTATACTANFGDSAFTGTVPSGFTAGFPGSSTISQARVMVMA